MSTTLSRKFRVDVTTDLTLASGWLQLNGIDDWSPQINPNLEETSAYDTTGWKTNEVTMQDWTATASLFRRIVTSVYDPGQELIRATQGQFGTAARCGVRWYDKNGGPEAYSGVALPELNRANTGVSNVEKWSITFACTDIPLNINITNPFSVASVPVITSVTPSGQGAAAAVAIVGQYFTGTVVTTGVKFGGVNATSWTVQNDGLITAVLPAGSAGSAPVIVTNATGASVAFPYTRT
jgi:hypothetical protein